MPWHRTALAAHLVAASVLLGCAQQSGPPPVQSMPQDRIYGRVESGWIVLLDNATSLGNWDRVGRTHWREIEGAIQADKGSGFLVSKEHYADFQLRAEFWVENNADSGILFRCANPGNVGSGSCYEANIQDMRADPAYGTGAIVGVARVATAPKATGRWNVYEITARGPQITVTLNGITTASTRDTRLASGPIALEYAGGLVRFRKVQIRPL